MNFISTYRKTFIAVLALIIVGMLFAACLLTGAVDIPVGSVVSVVMGGECENLSWRFIIMEARLPFAVTAMLAGASLSVSGLILQTVFQNPLAGPSVLGISSGSSLGVALLTLGAAPVLNAIFSNTAVEYMTTVVGAAIGAAVIIVVLISLSSVLRSSLMLLIAGMMISYLASSVISLLNFFAPSEDVKAFAVWGMGSYSGVSSSQLPVISVVTMILLGASMLCAKPLNALLLGERYAVNMGYSIRMIRSILLIISGALAAFTTAFCGPIAFIGLTVPHIARMLLNTSNHNVLLPTTLILGAAVSLLCALISVLPSSSGVIPINAVTPCVGVPVILYIIIRRKKLAYFN